MLMKISVGPDPLASEEDLLCLLKNYGIEFCKSYEYNQCTTSIKDINCLVVIFMYNSEC